MQKTCTKCKLPKVLDDFPFHKGTKDKKGSWCRECQRESHRSWLDHNREKARQTSLDWYYDNIEKARQLNKDYVETHRDRVRERDRMRPPEKNRARAHVRRARVNNGIVEHFVDTEIFERDEWICKLCDSPIDATLQWPDGMSKSLDHIVPIVVGGNHTKDNVQAAHLRCNISKGARV